MILCRPVPNPTHPIRTQPITLVAGGAQVSAAVRNGKQAMVFVHSRKETAKTARTLADLAGKQQMLELFSPQVRNQNPLVEVHAAYVGCESDDSRSERPAATSLRLRRV